MITIGIQSEPPWMLTGPMLSPPSASAVPSAIANSSTGNDHRMSNMCVITPSVKPPKYPANRPNPTASTAVITAAMNPTNSELRPP